MSSNVPLSKLFVVVVLSAFVVACGDDAPSANDTDNQVNDQNQNDHDDNNDDDNLEDNADRIEDPDDACEEAIDRSAFFEIPVPEATEGVTNMELMRIGDELWTIYLVEREEGGDEVSRAYWSRLDCGGEVVDGPTELRTADSEGEYSVALGSDGETTYLAWVEAVEVTVEDEDGDQSEELQNRARARAFETDGTGLTDEPFEIAIDVEEEDEPLRFLRDVDVDVNHDGHAAVLAQYAEGFDTMAAFQRLDETGQFDGPGFIVEEPEAPHSEPNVAVQDDFHVLVAYIEETGWGTGAVRHASIRPDGDSVDEGPTYTVPEVSEGNDSMTLGLSKNLAAGNTWMAYELGMTDDNTVHVRSGVNIGVEESQSSTVSAQASFGPDVSASETGGAKAWVSAGEVGNGIHFRRFDGAHAAIPDAGPVIDQYDRDEEDDWEAAGQPSIAWLTDDIYAAVWPEADGPVGRIIDFERAEANVEDQ